MDIVDPRSVRKIMSGIPNGMPFFQFRSLAVEQPSWPGIESYGADIFVVASSDSNTLGLGSKSFSYPGQQPTIEVGDVIRVDSYSSTVKGYMLGVVTSYSHSSGSNISTISVDVYQFGGEGTTTQWTIRQQLYGGMNVVQTSGNPYLAKLSVWDYLIGHGGEAEFGFPREIQNETIILVDTNAQKSFLNKAKYKGRIIVVEDMSDLHKPWLNTSVTATAVLDTTTIVTTWTYPANPEYPPTITETITRESENVSHTHTFTDSDFSPDSPGWQPADPGYHGPSRCQNYTETILGEYISTYVTNYAVIYPAIDPNAWYPINATTVIKDMKDSKLTDVQPAGFFTPPGM